MLTLISIITLFPLLTLGQTSWSRPQLCTFHDYEGDGVRLGDSYDNSPGWCGIRYSVLNRAQITAVHGLDASLCGQCLEVSQGNGRGSSVYVLAVDQKGAEGLDIAKSSFAALFPGQNPLDPQQCRWRVVPVSRCLGICVGTKDECTPGVRNLLPAYLLPKTPAAAQGMSVSSAQTPGNGVKVNNRASATSDGVINSLAEEAHPVNNTTIPLTNSSGIPTTTSPSSQPSSSSSATILSSTSTASSLPTPAPQIFANAMRPKSNESFIDGSGNSGRISDRYNTPNLFKGMGTVSGSLSLAPNQVMFTILSLIMFFHFKIWH